jgi:hypothetical protein
MRLRSEEEKASLLPMQECHGEGVGKTSLVFRVTRLNRIGNSCLALFASFLLPSMTVESLLYRENDLLSSTGFSLSADGANWERCPSLHDYYLVFRMQSISLYSSLFDPVRIQESTQQIDIGSKKCHGRQPDYPMHRHALHL